MQINYGVFIILQKSNQTCNVWEEKTEIGLAESDLIQFVWKKNLVSKMQVFKIHFFAHDVGL